MRTRKQLDAVRGAVRAAVALRRGDTAAAAQLPQWAATALEARVPAQLLAPIVGQPRPRPGRPVAAEPAQRDRVAAANAAVLEQLVVELDGDRRPPGAACLLGDAALLALLYDDLGAFSLRLPLAGRRSADDGRGLVDLHLRQSGGAPATAPLGVLGDAFRGSIRWVHADYTWRLPSRELLLALLVARLGDPAAPAGPTLWHHLSLAAGAWRDTLDHQRLVDFGNRLGIRAPLDRGLAILGELFPELGAPFEAARRALSIVERSIGVPLAARRLVALSLAAEAAAAPGALRPVAAAPAEPVAALPERALRARRRIG